MAFVYRELTADESARLDSLGLKNPWWPSGPARFGKSAAVDLDRDLIVVGMGGGDRETQDYWGLVKGHDALVLQGYRLLPDDPADHRLTVRVDGVRPKHSMLWHLPGFHKLLKESLYMLNTRGRPYSSDEPVQIRFAGAVGDLMEEA